MPTPPLVAWMNALPIEFAPGLRTHRRSTASQARGRVLDLGGWGDHLDAYRLGPDDDDGVDTVTMLDGPGDVRAGTGRDDPEGVTRLAVTLEDLAAADHEPFDSIVSLIRTPLVADLDGFLDSLLGLLAEDGRLYFLEPVRRAGRVGRVVAVGGRVNRVAGGLHLDRDLPRDIRARGLVVIDLDRFEVPSLSAPLRPFVEAVVRRPISSPESPPS